MVDGMRPDFPQCYTSADGGKLAHARIASGGALLSYLSIIEDNKVVRSVCYQALLTPAQRPDYFVTPSAHVHLLQIDRHAAQVKCAVLDLNGRVFQTQAADKS